MSRVLPYWGVRLLFLIQLLVLPVVAIWFPFLKMLPMIYRYRIVPFDYNVPGMLTIPGMTTFAPAGS